VATAYSSADGRLLSPSPCKRCGGEIWAKPRTNGKHRKRKYCGDFRCYLAANPKAPPEPRKTPEQRQDVRREILALRKIAERQGVCAKARNRKAAKDRRRERQRIRRRERAHNGNRPRGPFACQNVACGAVYYTRAKPDEGETYCSRECYFDVKARRKSIQKEIVALRRIAKRKGVCTKARDKAQARAKAKASREEKRNALESKPCRVCGCAVGYSFGCPRELCSLECKEIDHARKRETPEHRRRARAQNKKNRRKYGGSHRSRARRVGALYESFNVYDVFKRAGWHCEACGIPTPRRLRGTHHPQAPELDHVVALASGGNHHPDNAQCLCRRCNSVKSDKSMDYLTAWLIESVKSLEIEAALSIN
jgi:hypothetical protein